MEVKKQPSANLHKELDNMLKSKASMFKECSPVGGAISYRADSLL